MRLTVTAEDVTNKGRIDLTVRMDNLVYIIEFKVIDDRRSAGSALKQIKAKGYYEKFRQNELEIYLIGVEFDKENRNIAGFDWEKVL